MVNVEPSGIEAPHTEEREPPYEGEFGRTRFASVHVTLPTGYVRLVQVYEAVNVTTDPHLQEAALAGTLHRFETGQELAVPFVYHDPEQRKLALVLPDMLRHEELMRRAKLMTALAEDRDSPVPTYVSAATTVVGVAALRAYLERPSETASRDEATRREAAIAARDEETDRQQAAMTYREAAAEERESTLAKREASTATLEATLTQREKAVTEQEARLTERENALKEREGTQANRDSSLESQGTTLGQREERLHARAEQVTRREDELRAMSEELEAGRADIGMREQELESRVEMLHERESAFASRGATMGDDDVVQLVDEEVEELDAVEEIADIGDVEELQPLSTSPGENISGSVELVEDLADDVEEIVDDVEEIEEIESITGLHALPDDEEEEIAPSATQVNVGPQPSVAPPAGFLEGRLAATATLDDEGPRIFAKLPAGKEALFTDEVELLVQLVVVEECPVVLLSVVDGDGRPTVLRAPLDPRRPENAELLKKLRRSFEARVALFDGDGRYLRAVQAKGPREGNVLMILERVSKMRTAAAVDVGTAIERILSAPPPIRDANHPFAEGNAAQSAREAKDALDELTKWATHDRMDHARLVLSIPSDQVESAIRRLLEQSISFGLALSERLAKRAIGLEIAEDRAALVTRQLKRFSDTTKSSDRGGLRPEEVAEGWEQLLRSAADAEVAIDTDTHELAWNLIRDVRGGGSEVEVDESKIPEMGIPELVILLEHPRYRRVAAVELAGRDDAALAEKICKAVRKMPRSEVVRVVPKVLQLGDEAGDAIIDGLGARKTFVRQAFALSLGQLKLRRGVVPLLHLLASEQSEVWREVARVLGSFGTASLRTVTRQLKDPKGPQERYVLTLAHLAANGCEKQVDKLAQDERSSVAAMATEALTLRQEAGAVDERVRGEEKLTDESAILRFSWRYYAELEGRGTEDDAEPARKK